jgi:signal transduction histidine kinase
VAQALPIKPSPPPFNLARFLAWFVPSYLAAYEIGVAFYFQSASATTLWLTNGLVLAILLLNSRRRWFAIIVSAVVTHSLFHIIKHPSVSGVVWAIQTALIDNGEALICAEMTLRWTKGSFDISRLQHTLSLAAAVLIGSAFMALFGSASLGTLQGPASAFWRSWRLWWYGDLLGDMVFAPLVVAWGSLGPDTLKFVKGERVAEVLALGVVTAATTYLLFSHTTTTVPTNWLLPVLLWASLRFHPRVVLLLLMLATVQAVVSTINGTGPFVHSDMSVTDTVISLQSFIAVLALSMFVVSSLTADRNRVLALRLKAEEGVRALNAELEDRVAQRTAQFEDANRGLQAEMRVRAAAESALRSRNEELKSFAYTVSHDLKAPLRGISGYAQELNRKHASQLTERASFCVQQILTATRNLDVLIEDLLRYSRYDIETPTLTVIKLDALVERILADRTLEISQKNIQVSVELAVTEFVGWERGIAQVLANLIDNAIKYTRGNDAPTISISSAPSDEGVTVTVRDNGIGFDMKYHDRLFGLFNRLVHQDEYEGTGAGLAIAKKLVEKSKGRIWAESSLGNGAAFHIEIKRRDADPPDDEL